MGTMHWYNPTKRVEEDVPAPMSEAQAIGMLSWHPNSDEFIEEYRRKRVTSGIVESLVFTGEFFYCEAERIGFPSRKQGPTGAHLSTTVSAFCPDRLKAASTGCNESDYIRKQSELNFVRLRAEKQGRIVIRERPVPVRGIIG